MHFNNFGKLSTIISSNIAFLPFCSFSDANQTLIRLCRSSLHICEPLFSIFHLSVFAAFRIMSWNFMLIYAAAFSIFPPTCLIAHQHPTLNSYLPPHAPPPAFPSQPKACCDLHGCPSHAHSIYQQILQPLPLYLEGRRENVSICSRRKEISQNARLRPTSLATE